MAREQLTFTQVDISSLDEHQAIKWQEYLDAKAEFKSSLQSLAPAGRSVVFSEKYGTVLKVALTAAPKANGTAKVSLADFIAAQQASGHAV